jgi:hypothetical protein
MRIMSCQERVVEKWFTGQGGGKVGEKKYRPFFAFRKEKSPNVENPRSILAVMVCFN